MATDPPASGSGSPAPARLWASGRFTLRVNGIGSNWQRVIEIQQPYGVIGRGAGANILIDDRTVSGRHVYLHLDRRGLFAVDLASRSGTRIGERGLSAAWLRPGQWLEVAGRRIELIGLQVSETDADPEATIRDDPLADCRDDSLTRVTLYPSQDPPSPLVLNSELVFLGRSSSCGVQVEEPSAARIQCVLVRARTAAYVVDLAGRTTWLNGRPLRGPAPLHDGDVLTIGSARFECRIEPPASGWPATASTSVPARVEASAPSVAPSYPAELLPSLPPDLVPAEAQGQVLAWMMGVLQATQGEMLRRQAEFQSDVVQVLRQMRDENSTVLGKHLEKVESLHRELSSLRDEVRRRFGPSDAPKRPEPPKVPPLRIAPATPPENPEAAAAWLINRVNQIDQENRATWRELLGRLGPRGK